MSIPLEGTETLELPSDRVWESLCDLPFLIQCFPDVESITVESDRKVSCRVRPSFSFLKGRLDNSFELTDSTTKPTARFSIRGKGIGVTVGVDAQVTVEDVGPADTRLRWRADIVERGGLLKAVSKGLVEGAARKVIADAFAGFRQKLHDKRDGSKETT